MSSPLPFWARMHGLGALERTLDEAVRAADLPALWEGTGRPEVLLDVACLAGVELKALLCASRDVCGGAVLAGAHRWAEAGLEALAAGEELAAGFALGRVMKALAVAGDTAVARELRERLDLDVIEAALELPRAARPTPEDDLAGILVSYRAPTGSRATRSARVAR